MKNVLLFVSPMILGVCVVLLLVSQTSQQKVQEVKKTAVKTAPFSVENAPSQSLRGVIASYSGAVKWQSRTATEASTLTSIVPIQQGEDVETEDKGEITITIPSVCTVGAQAKTHLSFIQTLPIDVVIEQKEGAATYTKLSSSVLTVRSLHLIVNHISGQMDVIVDSKEKTITIKLPQGAATAAYNSANNVTTTVALSEGKELIFDDEARRAVVKKLSP